MIFAAGGGLRLLVGRMGNLGRRMRDCRDEDLLNVASPLRGTVIPIPLDTEDMDPHDEVTGRRVHDVAEWLREHGEGDGRPLLCRTGPVVPAARGPGTPFRPSCDSRHCRRLGAAPGPVPPSWGQ